MIRLKGGRIIDPANGRDEIGDLWIDDDRIIAPPPDARATETVDLDGCIVMAGAIDIHTHVAGGNVNTARLMLPQQHKAHARRPAKTALGQAGWSTVETGCRYAEMGFTTVIEPAIVPSHALHAHLEFADIPIVDKAGLAVLGNDAYLLQLLRDGQGPNAVADYVAYMLQATKALGVKCINAGGAAAFKNNVRAFSLDDEVPGYGLTSREIVLALQQAVSALGVPHPLHVHCNNLGLPGAVDTAIATMDAAGDVPMHFAHIQFYSYGAEGKRRFTSAAAKIAEAVNVRKNVTVDVGQVMFGQTVTVSCDTILQFGSRNSARPRKWSLWDGIGDGGGVVPYTYKATNAVNALQWAIGLELFLLIDDPWRVFFTTDHPNGAPFTAYPEIFALLMDRTLREEWMARLPKAALASTTLPSITREYSLNEIAVMTRAAPAKLLGLPDRGHLGPGALADIAVYRPQSDRAAMFRAAELVFKSGALVVRRGDVISQIAGRALTVEPPVSRQTAARVERFYDDTFGLSARLFAVPEHAVGTPEPFESVPCLST
ncbi:formylmethanofuran dehydrogenase subunit A [Rhodoligotrophos defluvii]|uniref:formylmethanofuran dehydrogenase subunit A n=1 Tax=Rhodoligotrophos defluvii TaxID=2561934 RepID=UPI0010C96DBD|nr:formylmethanofuran dehydrogenase subunit A [Rhodoligotrophos defluvii]